MTCSATAGSAARSFSPLVPCGRLTTCFVSGSTTNSRTSERDLVITVTELPEKPFHEAPV